ncbi:hypothetical protein ABI59_04435 [Acidobacteria bacterium Mor1]|nr:hypothetical protein ABI59_04435 [Acidobacteria bacterium Mor1]
MRPSRIIPVLALFCALAVTRVSATAQAGDVLWLDGEELSIQTNPLEAYLEVHPDERPHGNVISSGLWRGYVAEWRIEDEQLWLSDVEVLSRKPGDQFDTQMRSVMVEMFPDEDRVSASWFFGHIIIPRGEMVKYVHMGYASEYERYTVLTIKAGQLHARREMDRARYRRFRQAQFDAWKQTQSYQRQFAELLDPGDSEQEIEDFLFDAGVAEYITTVFSQDPEPSSPDASRVP